MLIDVEVARNPAGHVDQRMAAELFDHMIEKADPGRHVIAPGAVEIDLDRNVGFVSRAFYSGAAHGLRLEAEIGGCKRLALDQRACHSHLWRHE